LNKSYCKGECNIASTDTVYLVTITSIATIVLGLLYKKLEEFPEITDFDKLEHRREVLISYAIRLLRSGNTQVFRTGIMKFIELSTLAYILMKQYNVERERFKLKIFPILLSILVIICISTLVLLFIFTAYQKSIVICTIILFAVLSIYPLYKRKQILAYYFEYQSKRDSALSFYELLLPSIDALIGGRTIEGT